MNIFPRGFAGGSQWVVFCCCSVAGGSKLALTASRKPAAGFYKCPFSINKAVDVAYCIYHNSFYTV